MELTRIRGRDVVDSEGIRIGVVADLGVRLTSQDYPCVSHVLVRFATGGSGVVEWAMVHTLDEDRVELSAAATPFVSGTVPDDVLLVVRDVLDCQVFDAAGARLARVADVRLAVDHGTLRIMGVEVGVGAVLRRLGLVRTSRRWPEDPIDWGDLHLASARGHALMMRSATVHRLTPPQLAALLGHLPADRGGELLAVLPSEVAADAISRARPRLGARLMRTIAPHRAASIVGAMARDDATAALRHLSASELDAVLGHVDSVRALQLRALLAHPATTAGGLMNPDVLTLPAGTSLEDARVYVAAHAPTLDALMTVFTVDEDGRPVGAITPAELVTGRSRAATPPTVRLTDSVDEVVDAFALNDVLAVAVTGDDGRLVGAIAVDDVFEELLAERLPGRRRYRHVRSHRR